MTLPTIHSLHEGDPFPRGPQGECMCNWCRHWSPLLATIRAQLDAPGKALLEEYVSYIEQRAEDGDVAEAMLAGDWPGWEWIKREKALHSA